MIKVYRYPENIEDVINSEDSIWDSEEDLFEQCSDYSNYEEDGYKNLPVAPSKYHKLLDSLINNSFPAVVYTIDTQEDVKEMSPSSLGGGGFYQGEFSYYTDDYYIGAPEYGMGLVIAPKELGDALAKHFTEEEEEEFSGNKAKELKLSDIETSSDKSWRLGDLREIGAYEEIPALLFGDIEDENGEDYAIVALYYGDASNGWSEDKYNFDCMYAGYGAGFSDNDFDKAFQQLKSDEDTKNYLPDITAPTQKDLDMLREASDKYIKGVEGSSTKLKDSRKLANSSKLLNKLYKNC